MRPVMFIALLGTTFSLSPARAQNSPEQPASGTAESHQRHGGPLFEGGPARPSALAEARRTESRRTPGAGTVPDSAHATPPAAAPALVTVQAVPPGPPQKNLTGEEFAFIRVGSTAKELLEVLGPPSSRVIVPDDDGHLRESLQYWVKGSPMGTVRLDNGRVVQIETKGK
jgi:hypothetical protein